MFSTKVLRQAAQAASHHERTPLIKFIGKRSVPSNVDHTPHAHPASPTGSLPKGFASSGHNSFSSYRQHAQQFGPLRKTIQPEIGVGGASGSDLGPVHPPKGMYFDRNELPARFRRAPLTLSEIEMVETGGASAFA